MKKVFLTRFAPALLLAGTLAAQVVNTDQNWSSNPPTGNEYWFANGETPNTWTINGNITVGNGVGPDSRLFVGLGAGGYNADGILNLVGANGSGDTLLLNGCNPADPILGHLGHTDAYRGTLNILGGLAVTWGGRALRIGGNTVTNTINVITGSLNYTTPGFSFDDQGGRIMHTMGTNGAIVVAALIDSATGFDQWGVSKGMSAGDVLLETEPDFRLVFTQNQPNTTITAIKPVKGTLIRFY